MLQVRYNLFHLHNILFFCIRKHLDNHTACGKNGIIRIDQNTDTYCRWCLFACRKVVSKIIPDLATLQSNRTAPVFLHIHILYYLQITVFSHCSPDRKLSGIVVLQHDMRITHKATHMTVTVGIHQNGSYRPAAIDANRDLFLCRF